MLLSTGICFLNYVLFFTNEYGYLVLLMMKRCEELTSYSEHCQVFRTVVFILQVFKFVSK